MDIELVISKTYNIKCRTTDFNDDKICYEFKYTNIENNESSEWQSINDIPEESGNSTNRNWNFDEGTNLIMVRAYDCREKECIDKKGYDGISEIQEEIIHVG